MRVSRQKENPASLRGRNAGAFYFFIRTRVAKYSKGCHQSTARIEAIGIPKHLFLEASPL